MVAYMYMSLIYEYISIIFLYRQSGCDINHELEDSTPPPVSDPKGMGRCPQSFSKQYFCLGEGGGVKYTLTYGNLTHHST